jgi:hypothetical protein
LVKKLEVVHEATGAVDERWYWLTPMLLDFAEFPEAARTWSQTVELSRTWAGVEDGEEDAGWSRHVKQAAQTLAAVRSGREHLGPPPEDLFDVLGLAASAAPAVAALRALVHPKRCCGFYRTDDLRGADGKSFSCSFQPCRGH